MCGVLAGSARFTERLTLGYRDAVATADSSLHAAGTRVVGHEFHRTAVTFRARATSRRGRSATARERPSPTARCTRGVHAAYLHTHAAAHPGAATRFVAAARSRIQHGSRNSKLAR